MWQDNFDKIMGDNMGVEEKQKEFWSRFLEKAEDVVPLYRGVKPKDKKLSYLETNKGKYCDFTTSMDTTKKIAWVEKCFQEKGPNGVAESNRKFKHFLRKKKELDAIYGNGLNWTLIKENKKRSIIRSEEIEFDIDDPDSWDDVIDKLLDMMARLIKAIESGYPGIDDFVDSDSDSGHSTTTASREDGYRPQKSDAIKAISQITPKKSVSDLLGQIEKNCLADGKVLVSNWRLITERNIREYWFK